MNSIFNKVEKWFDDMNKDLETKYLEKATDHVDLENRMKAIDRGEAPFQTNNFTFRHY